MRPDVRLHLLRNAMAFYDFLAVPGLLVSDIVLTGSNAAFNYTDLSDLDVHLIVEFAKSPCPAIADNLFTTKKALWSATYDVTIKGQPVELYVEDEQNPANSNGLYSLLHGEWKRRPKPVAPARHDSAVVRKVEALASDIDDVIARPDPSHIDALMSRLRGLRQNGLLTGGEFSVENLAYKALRALGYLDALYAARKRATVATLSLEGAT